MSAATDITTNANLTTTTGGVTLNATNGNINVLASIISNNGNLDLTAGSAVSVNSSGSTVEVSTNKDLIMTAQSVAVNGIGFLGSTMLGTTVDLTIGAGGVSLTSTNGIFAQIKSTSLMTGTIDGPLSLFGNTGFQSLGTMNITSGGINIEGGSYAYSPAYILSSGDMTLNSYGLVQLIGGSGALSSDAGILVINGPGQITLNTPNSDLNLLGGSRSGLSRGAIETESGPISINASGTPGANLVLQGGSGQTTNAIIQPGGGNLIANFSSEVVIAGGSSVSGDGSASLIANGDVSLTGYSFQLSSKNSREGSNNSANIVSSAGSVTVNATDIIELLGVQSDNPNEGTLISANKGISITANESIVFTGNATVETQSESLLVIAGGSISIGNFSKVINAGPGDITLVVDNQFPTFPFFGPGQFNFLSGAFVSPHGGVLRIFTSVRSQNTIEGALNGQTFVPGELYVDSNTEQWGVYHPNSFSGGEAFTLFYKNSAGHPAPGEPGGVPFPRGGASRNQILSLSRQSEVDIAQFFYELSESQ